MFFFRLVLFLVPLVSFTQEFLESKMQKFSTKQDVNNLRFLSQDGRYTYYQRRSGTLVFATNFDVHDVIKSPIGTQYDIVSTRARKFLAVAVNEHYFTFFDTLSSSKIYVIEYGTNKARLLGNGHYPQLHLSDTWVSFYEKNERKLHFVNATNELLKFNIDLPIKKNPYFIPTSTMISTQHILYVDQNEKGIYALVQLDRNSKQSRVLHKLENPLQRMEVCQSDEYLYLGIFNLHSYDGKSSILRSDKKEIKFNPFYASDLSDIGHIICDLGDGKVYFVMALENGDHELTQLDPLKKEPARTTVLSDLKEVTQVIEMDGKLLIPFRGIFYVPMGQGNYINTENLTEIRNKANREDNP